MKSLSEIETTSKRASKAAGYSWGVSEEVGKNTRLLEMFGLPGIKNLNDYYKEKKNKEFENLSIIKKENKSNKFNFCPIHSGVNFLDQVKSLESFQELKFNKIAYPLLFLPFISRASEVVGKRLHLKIDTTEFLLNYNNNIYSSFQSDKIIETANVVTIKFLKNIDLFSEIDWRELYKLSEETFVEETDSLKKSGAGAGLTDND